MAYPDAEGVSQLGYKSLSFEGKVRSGTAGETLTLSVEGTNGFEWIDVIGPFIDETGASPITAPLVNVANATDSFAVSIDLFPYAKWRVKVVVTGTTSDNEVKVTSYQKAV
jgi:hypothetical protein